MDATQTEKHATRHGGDDSTPRMIELIVVLASLASLTGVEMSAGRRIDQSAAILPLASSEFWAWLRRGSSCTRSSCCVTPGCIIRNKASTSTAEHQTDVRRFRVFGVHHRYDLSGLRHRSEVAANPENRTLPGRRVVLPGAIILAMTLNLVVTIVAH
jgi:hypothetical protein